MVQRADHDPYLILDLKYKTLEEHGRAVGIAEGDVYQMLAYATRLNCPFTLLLYPETRSSGMIREKVETIGYPASLSIATINLRKPLDDPSLLITELKHLLHDYPTFDTYGE
jgi:5-methylcytosine-specific restriction enzyme subunit McrC